MPQEAYCYIGVTNATVLKKYQASSPFPDNGGGGVGGTKAHYVCKDS